VQQAHTLVHSDSQFDTIRFSNQLEIVRFPQNRNVRFERNLLECVCKAYQLCLSVLSMLASYP